MAFRVGMDVWIPCETTPGPPIMSERRVYLKVGEAEWFGFVNAADIREEGDRIFVRATVIGMGREGIVVQLRGHSMGSEAIQAPPEVFQRYGTVSA